MIRRFFRILFRVIIIIFVFSLFPALLGQVLFGVRGAVAAVVSILFILIAAACRAELSAIKMYRANLKTPPGLKRSLELLALARENGKTRAKSYLVNKSPKQAGLNRKVKNLPRFLIYSNPTPQLIVVRSLGSRGSVLASQGLIALLNEAELRVMLATALDQLEERGIVLQSFCLVVATRLLKFAPRGWVNFIFTGQAIRRASLSPIALVGFSILYPVARFLTKLGQTPPRAGIFQSPTHMAAQEKISQSVAILGSNRYGSESYLKTDILSR